MASYLKKVMLKVGPYISHDGEVIVTADRLRHWAREHQRLCDANQVVPVDYDHPDDVSKANPISMSAYQRKRRGAATTVGRMREFNLHESGNAAEVVLSFSDKKAAEKAEGNDVFLSPVIKDFWMDGHGNQYRDVITHMDLVVHPVDYSQEPFEKVGSGSSQMALRLSLDVGQPKYYRLSASPDQEGTMDEDELKEMLDVSDDEVGTGEDGGAAEDEVVEDEETVDTTEMSADPENAGFDAGSQILADLESAGIVAPQGVDPLSDPLGFLSQLSAALRQKALSEGGAPAQEMGMDEGVDPAAEDGEEIDTEDLTTTQPQFATMSLQRRLSAMETENARLRNSVVSEKKKHLVGRVARLLKDGRCTPEEADRMTATVRSTRMSLDGDGELASGDILTFIKSRESIPKNAVVPLGQRLSLDGVHATNQPAVVEDGGPVTADQAKKQNDKLAERHPHMYRNK